MPQITIQKPTDQPLGRNRLLEGLRRALGSEDFDKFYLIVAFAKVGPLLRLSSAVSAWRAAGRAIQAIVGIDEKGTSKEALEFALAHFSETHVAHVPGLFKPTFHPKLYLFAGQNKSLAFLGSNNLTVGGTETNFESHICFDLDLPKDAALHDEILGCWSDALAASSKLTPALLAQLVSATMVLTEAQMRRSSLGSPRTTTTPGSSLTALFPSLSIVPPSALPPGTVTPRRAKTARPPKGGAAAAVQAVQTPPVSSVAQALVIEVIPHHNGEVLLSKKAVDEAPAFFGWPFSGKSTPKKKGRNQPYPQRMPDPVVDITVFDATGTMIVHHDAHKLNTVYYAAKSEIRITVPPDVQKAVPAYSILVMREASTRDYELEFHAPRSPQHATYLQRCNQTMPSGGKDRPRKFGWI